MSLQTDSKAQFVYDLLALNTTKEAAFTANVRLKFYFKDTKIYVDSIYFNIATMELAINGEPYGQYVIDLLKLPYEVTYEFDY